MVSVDCNIQNGSEKVYKESEITNNTRTNGTAAQVDTIRSRKSQCSASETAPNTDSSDNSSTDIKIIEFTTSLPPSSNLKLAKKPRKLEINFQSPRIRHQDNTNCSKVPLKSSKSTNRASKPLVNLKSKLTNIKRGKMLEKLSPASKLKENRPMIDNSNVRRWYSEPCMTITCKIETNDRYPCKRRNSEKFVNFGENTTLLKPLNITILSKKNGSKMVVDKTTTKLNPSRLNNNGKNGRKISSKQSNSVESKKIENKTILARVRTRRKTNQATQVEHIKITKEVEAQTDLDDNDASKQKTIQNTKSSLDGNEKPKKSKTMSTQMSATFKQRYQRWLEKRKTCNDEKYEKYEFKRWARPALVLQKEPFKIRPKELKLTIPKPLKLETDVRQQKWEQYMKEFKQRREKLEKEKLKRERIELKKYRKTLKPAIHKIPYKKLGIKPKKRKTNRYHSSGNILAKDSKFLNDIHFNTVNSKSKNTTNTTNHKTNNFKKVHKKNTVTSNLKRLKQKESSVKAKRTDKTSTQNIEIEFNSSYNNPSKMMHKNFENINDKISINQNKTIKEKNNSNMKNLRNLKSLHINNNKNMSSSFKGNIRSKYFALKDEYDCLYGNRTPTFSTKVKTAHQITPAIKIPK